MIIPGQPLVFTIWMMTGEPAVAVQVMNAAPAIRPIVALLRSNLHHPSSISRTLFSSHGLGSSLPPCSIGQPGPAENSWAGRLLIVSRNSSSAHSRQYIISWQCGVMPARDSLSIRFDGSNLHRHALQVGRRSLIIAPSDHAPV